MGNSIVVLFLFLFLCFSHIFADLPPLIPPQYESKTNDILQGPADKDTTIFQLDSAIQKTLSLAEDKIAQVKKQQTEAVDNLASAVIQAQDLLKKGISPTQIKENSTQIHQNIIDQLSKAIKEARQQAALGNLPLPNVESSKKTPHNTHDCSLCFDFHGNMEMPTNPTMLNGEPVCIYPECQLVPCPAECNQKPGYLRVPPPPSQPSTLEENDKLLTLLIELKKNHVFRLSQWINEAKILISNTNDQLNIARNLLSQTQSQIATIQKNPKTQNNTQH